MVLELDSGLEPKNLYQITFKNVLRVLGRSGELGSSLRNGREVVNIANTLKSRKENAGNFI